MGKRTIAEIIRIIEQLPQEIERKYPQVLRTLAKDVELEVKNRVLLQRGGETGGIGIDDQPIRDNVEKTIKRKLEKHRLFRGAVKSLWDTGRMMGTVWQQRLSRSEKAIRMGVPEDRKEIVGYLQEKGYDNWFGIPTMVNAIPWHEHVSQRLKFWILGILRGLFR